MDKKKVLLALLRFVPVVGALCCAIDSLLSYYFIDTVWLGFIMRLTFLFSWIALAIYFRFCLFYMILVFYIIVCTTLNTIDYIWGIPISSRDLFVLHIGLIGVTALTATIAHVRDKGKHTLNP